MLHFTGYAWLCYARGFRNYSISFIHIDVSSIQLSRVLFSLLVFLRSPIPPSDQ